MPEAKKFFKNYSLNDYNEAIRKVVFIISYKKMKLNKYNIHDSCKKYLKTYFGSSQYLEVGKTIYPTKDLLDCICEVHLMSNDKKLINSDVEILRE
ncbi:hypothetical protein FACS189459_4780 [Bacilli bacterium]|nr:hypothetical protein FACS189459_4780 [Bacilli bacterium]